MRPVNYIPGHVYGTRRAPDESPRSGLRSIQLEGKGIYVEYLFKILIEKYYPNATWTYSRPKWYQSQVRHVLKIEGLAHQAVAELGSKIEEIGIPIVVRLL